MGWIQVIYFFQVIECRVCNNVFGIQGDKIPRLLMCGHTLCHLCLTRLPQSQELMPSSFVHQHDLTTEEPLVSIRTITNRYVLCL